MGVVDVGLAMVQANVGACAVGMEMIMLPICMQSMSITNYEECLVCVVGCFEFRYGSLGIQLLN